MSLIYSITSTITRAIEDMISKSFLFTLIFNILEFIEKEWRLYEKIQTQLTETNQTETARYQEVKAYLCALEQAKTYNQQTL